MIAYRTNLRSLSALMNISAVKTHPFFLYIRYKQLSLLKPICKHSKAFAVNLFNLCNFVKFQAYLVKTLLIGYFTEIRINGFKFLKFIMLRSPKQFQSCLLYTSRCV